MKFLTDENIGFKVINPLRKNGFDIKSILETNPGADDVKVLSIANTEDRILITTDKDFWRTGLCEQAYSCRSYFTKT